MTGWKIQPQGVVTVLTRVNREAESLGTSLGSLGDDVMSAVAATNSPAIGGAVQSFFDQVAGPQLDDVSARISASVTGASAATEAYVSGDLEMAANSQAQQIVAINGAGPRCFGPN